MRREIEYELVDENGMSMPTSDFHSFWALLSNVISSSCSFRLEMLAVVIFPGAEAVNEN
jgi:hypothetical protein